MPKLLDRQKQIPQGLVFYIPALNWKSQPWQSFDTIVNGAISVLKGNPHVAQKLGWDLSYDAMADRVDLFNATICEKMQWNDYITGVSGSGGTTGEIPFPTTRSVYGRLQGVVAGASAIVESIARKEEAVPAVASAARATVCAACPLNEKGDWLSIFTVPAADAIRKAMGAMNDMDLKTPSDHLLGCCSACDCPLRLKVHFQIERILSGLTPGQKGALWDKCWIRSESEGKV